MAAFSSVVAAVGLGLTAVGTVQQVQAQGEVADATREAEDARQAQANLTARRKMRQRVRQSIIARSEALANTTNRGAAQGSALPGTEGQIAGETGRAVSGIEQNRGLGNQVFAANRQAADARGDVATGQGLSSLGGSIFKARGEIGSYGASVFNSGA